MKHEHNIPLARPSIASDARRNVDKCFEENFYSHGFFNSEFEQLFSAFTGSRFAVSCCNGTAALWLALKAAEIKKGDEVIVPTMTFSATAAAVVAAGGTPVFVDSRAKDLSVDPRAVELAVTKRTKAIIPVDLYGLAAPYAELRVVARKHGLIIIEDAAEGLGGHYKGKPLGTLGDIGTFSFFGNKVITTGEGGMCVMNDPVLFDRVTLFKNHGATRERSYWTEVSGFNMRMTNVQAAIGVSQIKHIDNYLDARYRIFEEYLHQLDGISSIRPLPYKDRTYSPWFFTLRVKGKAKEDVVAALKMEGIDSRSGFYPLHLTPAFSRFVRKGQHFPVAEELSKGIVNVPTYVGLTKQEVGRVARALIRIANED